MALARLKGKIPKEIPFELKRCESCRRAKQGAIVCRVVRAHDGITEPDGGDWAPPAGFREWLAAWKAGDGKSTIRTPTKKPKRPRPPPKPKEEEPERRSGSGSFFGFGGGRGRLGFFVGVRMVDLPSPAFQAASHSTKPSGGAQSPPSGSVIPSWALTTRHTMAPCFARRQLSQRLSSKGISFGILPFSLASAMVFASRLRSYFCFFAPRVDGGAAAPS